MWRGRDESLPYDWRKACSLRLQGAASSTLRGGVKTPPYEAKDKWAVMARLRAGHARPLQGSDVKWRSSRKQQSFTFAGVRGRLAAHNERRQFAAQTRSCGCLPRRGKHCSLPSFAALNCGPTLATPQHPSSKTEQRARVRCVETAAIFFGSFFCWQKKERVPGRQPSPVRPRTKKGELGTSPNSPF